MNHHIANEPTWKRDQRLQADLAASQTTTQRAVTLRILMNAAIARNGRTPAASHD